MSTPEAIRNNLLDISNESGTYFLALSNSFPVLIEEINSNGRDGASHDKTTDFLRIKNELSATITSQQELLEANKQFLSSIRQRNADLLQSFSDNMHLLDSIHNIIVGIKDGSEEMEVISLNAMVVSIKSGREGQAFSYITSNLKSMSLRLIKQSDELIEHGDKVQSSLAQLRTQVEQESTIDHSAGNLSATTNTRMMESIESMSHRLNDILLEARNVLHPITEAMEGIQMQDIIRQSLDDVLMALTKVQEPAINATPEQQLEQYTANTRLTLLSSRCLTQIKEKLDESIKVFESNRDEANVLLNQLDESRQSLMYAITSDRSPLEELEDSMNESIESFNTFSSTIQSYQTVQTNILDAVEDIQEAVHYMYSCFNAFLPIISNLQYVAIAQRIEVARNAAISSIKDTVEHMANLIGNTKENIETAQKQLEEFTDIYNAQIRRYMESADSNKLKFVTLSRDKNTFTDKLLTLKDALSSSVENFNIFSPTFFEQYDQIGTQLDSLKRLSSRLNKSISDVQELHEQYSKQKYDTQTKYNLPEMEIHNADMENFLKKFTITENKLEAGNIEGIEVSSGAAAGDITFF